MKNISNNQWPYSQLSQKAKEAGGPENYLFLLKKDAFSKGFGQGRHDQRSADLKKGLFLLGSYLVVEIVEIIIESRRLERMAAEACKFTEEEFRDAEKFFAQIEAREKEAAKCNLECEDNDIQRNTGNTECVKNEPHSASAQKESPSMQDCPARCECDTEAKSGSDIIGHEVK